MTILFIVPLWIGITFISYQEFRKKRNCSKKRSFLYAFIVYMILGCVINALGLFPDDDTQKETATTTTDAKDSAMEDQNQPQKPNLELKEIKDNNREVTDEDKLAAYSYTLNSTRPDEFKDSWCEYTCDYDRKHDTFNVVISYIEKGSKKPAGKFRYIVRLDEDYNFELLYSEQIY